MGPITAVGPCSVKRVVSCRAVLCCRHAFFDDTLHVVQLSNSEHVRRRRRRRRTRMLIHARAPTHAHMHDAQRALFCV